MKSGKAQILKSIGQLLIGSGVFLVLFFLFIYWQSSGYEKYVIYVQVKGEAAFNKLINTKDPSILEYGRKDKNEIIAMDNDVDSGDGADNGKLRWYVCGGIDCDEGWESRFIETR